MTKKNIIYLLIIIINLTLLSVILIKEKTVDEISNYYSAEELIKDNMISMVEVNESGETIAINAVPAGDNWYAVCECTNGSIKYYGKEKKFVITSINLTSGSLKCKVTFRISKPIKEQILANNTPLSDASVNFTKSSETSGLYYTADSATYGEDGQKIYYYRGNVTNNWVSFGGYLWRIVRTTSEGGIKLAYSGEGSTTLSAFINTNSSFNGSSYSLKYNVGYTYNGSSYTGTQTNSTIKGVIDSWYNSWINNHSEVINYLSNAAVYCNDRSEELNSNGNAWTSGSVFYPSYSRLYINKRPSFVCSNKNASRYASSNVTGNGYLTKNPIALLTADEVAYAGLVYDSSIIAGESYIMNNATEYGWWTMSPCNFVSSNSKAGEIGVNSLGFIEGYYVNNTKAVRPSVSLNKCVSVIEGDGTKTSPYKLTDALCK